MWFKSCFIYQIRDAEFAERCAASQLTAQHGFNDCLPTQPVSLGLVPPHRGMHELQLTSRQILVWKLQRQERLLPTSVVNETLAERVEALQEAESRRVGRNERQDLKDEITQELLPRAFTRNQQHMIVLDRESGWLFVQSGSETRADELTAHLREVLGELPVVPLGALCQPEPVWAAWLSSGDLPADVEVADELTLVHPAEESTVRTKQLPWDSAEVQQLLTSGYRPSQLLLHWQDQLTLQINDKSALKRLKFADELVEQAANDGGDDALAEWEAGLHLMTAALRTFSNAWLEWCQSDPAPEPKPSNS